MKSQNQILNESLDRMPRTFSSNLFANISRKKGLTELEIRNGVTKKYLHRYTMQDANSKRTWHKISNNLENKNIPKNNFKWERQDKDESSKESKINEAISLLNSNGYRVMKRIEEWIEVTN